MANCKPAVVLTSAALAARDDLAARFAGHDLQWLTVDLTPVPAARVGSVATLWGEAANGAVLSIDAVAHSAGTVGYELMCAVAPRVPVVAG